MNRHIISESRHIILKAARSLFTLLLAALMAFSAAAPSIPARAASGNMQITPIDFGDSGNWGDSTMISSGGKNLLMDTYIKDNYDTLMNYLDDHHFYTFDIYLSHYHYDHMDQIPSILYDSRFNVSKVYLPDPAYLKKGAQSSSYCKSFLDGYNNIVTAANDTGTQIVYLKKGSSFTVGNANINILWGCSYSSGTYDASYINNNSLVAKVTSGTVSYLNCGDIETQTESQIVSSGINISADIFKLNHHGGNTSNSAAFLKKVNPSFAYYNWVGDSPSSFGGSWVQTAINNLKNTCNIYSTRYNGMLTFSVKAGHISVAGERNMNSVNIQIKDSSGQVINTVNYQFNNALDYVITASMKSTAATVSSDDSATTLPERYAYVAKFIETSGGVKYRNKDGSYSAGQFQKIDGETYYFDENGYRVTGFRTIDGKTYYFDPDGIMLLRWKRINGKKYLFDPVDGHMHTGWEWVSEKNAWYYLSPQTGYLLEGWLDYKGKKYYLAPVDFYAVTGWQKLDGKWYFFDKTNADMKTGWLTDNGKTYYLGTDGVMVTGTHNIDGRTYTFSASGALSGQAPAGSTGTSSTGTSSAASSAGTSSGSSVVSNETKWVKVDGCWKYLLNGKYLTDCFYKISGYTYCFDENGNMLLGFNDVKGKTYYFDGSGKMLLGWQKLDGKWYFFDKTNGAMKTEWLTDGGRTYYLGTDGVMVTGTQTIDGKTYTFGAGGSLIGEAQTGSSGTSSSGSSVVSNETKWVKVDGYWKYLLSGKYLTDCFYKIGGYTYCFDENGNMLLGFNEVDGKTYYFDGSGKMLLGWQKLDGRWYFFDKTNGAMKTEWLTDGDRTYYLGTDGVMVTGTQTIGGKTYIFSASGALSGQAPAGSSGTSSAETSSGTSAASNVTKWEKVDGYWKYLLNGKYLTGCFRKINGKTYCFDENGNMLIGFHEVNGKTYYFDASGMMLIGWKRIDDRKYYFDPIDGHMHTGWEWVSENSAWYYLSPETGYLLEGWLDYNGKKYYLTPGDYYAGTGWQMIDGKWYFFDRKNADMKTGWLTIDSYTFYLGTDGVMVTGTQTIDGKTYTFRSGGSLIGEAPSQVSTGSSDSGTVSAASWSYDIYTTSGRTNSWDNASDSDMPLDYSTKRNNAFVNNMIAYATYFVDKIDYASSVTGDDPTGLRSKRLRVGGKTDCSWFVYHVLHKFGLVGDEFIHSYEWGNDPDTYPGGVNIGTDVSKASPGDIICTGRGTSGSNSHVMIYIGGGKVVECAAGYGVIISGAPSTARQIVHFTCLPVCTSAPFKSASTGTWISSNGTWKFKVGESFLTNCFQNIDGEMYYFDKDGVCATGWKTIDGKKYYFAAGCQMYLRWKRIDGEKYYFDPLSGYMHTGWEWVPEKDAWYYLDPDTGATVTGTRTIDGKTYTFGSDGAMQ